MLKWMSSRYSLDVFFYPRNVAIVGATRNPAKPAYYITENLVRLGFTGKIYPINPNANEILGLKCYPSLEDVPDDIDLVISLVPAPATLNVVKESAEKGVKGIVVIAGGFSEGGEVGGELEKKISEILRKTGMRLLGPNTLSPINPSNNLIVSFRGMKELKKGSLAFCFQSGMYEPKLGWIFNGLHLGVSKIIDVGNKLDVNEVDVLEYLSRDDETKVIALHIENIKGDSRRFMELLKETVKKKPVIIVKGGRTSMGAKASLTHTGSLSGGSYTIFEAALKQAGAIHAQTLEEFFDFAKVFEFLKPPAGNRVAIITLSGGEGVIAVDCCEENGFKLAELKKETVEQLRKVYPPWNIPSNPFDMGPCIEFHGNAKVCKTALDSISRDENVDCIVIQLPAFVPPPELDEVVKSFLRLKEVGKPAVIWRATMGRQEDRIVEELERNYIPVYPSVDRAIKALGKLYKYKVFLEKVEGKT